MLKTSNQLAYIDHNYHIKTKSGDFLRDVFKYKFLIKDFWINKDLQFSKDFFLYKNFFFFQILPPIKILEKIKNQNIMWAPMYDSPHHPIGFSPLLWKIVNQYNIKVLSFSKNLTEQMIRSKVNFVDLKYYKKSNITKRKPKKKINIFFWYREDINIKDWIKLFSSSEVNKIDLLYLKKNKKLIIPPEIKSKFRINYIRKNFLKSESFKKILNNNDVFVSPRKKEGIGMAQVEAISQGKYIIGYNDSTMKEYIKNEKIGFIFPSNKKIKISLINKFFNYRLNDNKESYNKWEKDKKKILIFFNKKIKKTLKNKINYIDIFLSYYLKLIFRKIFLFTR